MNTKVRLLIIEDEELICWSLKHSFERVEGYDVNCVSTGNDALQKLHENNYDIVITDLNLPDIDDFEIVKKIKNLASRTPVIVISAYLTEPVMKGVSEQGVYTCINKPFDIDDVIGEVRKAIKFPVEGRDCH